MSSESAIPNSTPASLRYFDVLEAVREVGLPGFATAIVQDIHRRTGILPVQLGGLDTPANRRAVRAEAATIVAEQLEDDINALITRWRRRADVEAAKQPQPFIAEAVRQEGYGAAYRYAAFLLESMVEMIVLLWAFKPSGKSKDA